MVWARLDDQFHSHPKVAELDPAPALVPLMAAAIGLNTLALSWCADKLTDGFVPRTQPARLVGGPVDNLVEELLRVGLWEKHPKGYVIHDYLDYNYSAAQVANMRKTKSEAGKRGAQARWGSDIDSTSHGSSYGTCHGTCLTDAMAEAIAPAMAEGMAKGVLPSGLPWQNDGTAMPPNPESRTSIKKNSRSKDPVENPGADRTPCKSEPKPIGGAIAELVTANGGELPADEFADIDFGEAAEA